jgi:hypothetical protein
MHPGQTYSGMSSSNVAASPAMSLTSPGITPQHSGNVGMTTLDVAASAERLMMSGYHYDSQTHFEQQQQQQQQFTTKANANANSNISSNNNANTSGGSRPNSRPPTPPHNASEAIGLLGEVVAQKLELGVGTGNPSVFARTDVTPVVTTGGRRHFFDSGGDFDGGEQQQQTQQQLPNLSGVATATNPNSAFASSTECLHLTLLLRRTLSELDARSKHLNESNVEKLKLHGEVERCKVKLEALMLEGNELRNRTEAAEDKARTMYEDEQAAINAALAKAAAAEKRFMILVDWSRKEESKRAVAEESLREALMKIEQLVKEHEESGKGMKEDLTAMQKALEGSNAQNLAKHKDLMSSEAEIMELNKRLGVSEQLSKSAAGENLALKNLCGKLEVELEGTKNRLNSVESNFSGHVSELSEALRSKERESGGYLREVEHWKKVYQEQLSRQERIGEEKEEVERRLASESERVRAYIAREKGWEEKVSTLQAENESMGRKLYEAEERTRRVMEERSGFTTEINVLKQKNESLNRMVDGLEDDFRMKRDTGAALDAGGRVGVGGVGSPSLLRYGFDTIF